MFERFRRLRSTFATLGTLGTKTREAEALARHAELNGDLVQAARLWADAGRADEAARVMVLRGDAETDGARRRQLYVQAVGIAPPGSAVSVIARRKRGMYVIAAARDGAKSAAVRQDLLEAAADLEAIGEASRAADAYALAGDVEGEARALVEAGDVERLEDVLERDRVSAGDVRQAELEQIEIDRRMASGHRREARALAEARAARAPGDGAAAEQARAIAARRAMAESGGIAIELRGRRVQLALGDEVTVGRTEGTIAIASPAVSRRHLVIARGASGAPNLRDLGSRNGTELRGLRIAGALDVPADGLDVKLGGEVPLRASFSGEIAGAIVIDAGGVRVVAPLGPARLGIGGWRLEAGPDGWVELVTEDDPPGYLGGVQLGPRTALLAGDAITAARGGEVVLRVPGG